MIWSRFAKFDFSQIRFFLIFWLLSVISRARSIKIKRSRKNYLQGLILRFFSPDGKPEQLPRPPQGTPLGTPPWGFPLGTLPGKKITSILKFPRRKITNWSRRAEIEKTKAEFDISAQTCLYWCNLIIILKADLLGLVLVRSRMIWHDLVWSHHHGSSIVDHRPSMIDIRYSIIDDRLRWSMTDHRWSMTMMMMGLSEIMSDHSRASQNKLEKPQIGQI